MRSLAVLLVCLVVPVMSLLGCGGDAGAPAQTGTALDVSSTPAGAAVFVDGQETGRVTPAILTDITASAHALALRLTGYEEWLANISLASNQTLEVRATLVPASPNTGSIAIESNPSGAQVTLDAQATGVATPALFTMLAPGPHTVYLDLPQRERWQQTVQVQAGQTTRITAQLLRLFLAGSASRTITPAGAVWLAGFSNNRRSTGVHDDLKVAALVLSDGQQEIVFLSVDSLGLMAPLVDAIREAAGIEPGHLILGSSHTHSGPDSVGLWGPDEYHSGVDPAYLEQAQAQAAACIVEARSELRAARIRLASADTEDLALSHNSRASAQHPDPTDFEMSLMRVQTPAGQAIATVVNWACHAEVLTEENTLVTADYVHYLRAKLEAQGAGNVLFLNGAIGGMVTPTTEERTFAAAQTMGERLASRALSALQGTQVIAEPALSAQAQTMQLPLGNPIFYEALQRGLISRTTIEMPNTDPRYNPYGLGMETTVTVASVAPAQFAVFPGEAFPAIGLRVKSEMTGLVRFFVGLGNDELGYVMDDNEYGVWPHEYESSMSVGPATGMLLEAALVDLLAP